MVTLDDYIDFDSWDLSGDISINKEGKVYFCGDSFYGEYSIKNFDILLCKIVLFYLKLKAEYLKDK